jgi:hypothetical protein
MYIRHRRDCEVCSARSRKMYFMKSATEYWKSAPNGCSCKKQKNVFYEKRNSDWNICSTDNVLG